MKKGIARAICMAFFCGVFLYLIAHITYVLRTNTEEKRNLMGFYYEKNNSLDAVFIGSSSLWRSINPLLIYEDYGIASYIIATSAQRPSSLYYLLKEAQKTQPDAVYFIDVSTAKYDNEVWEKQNEGSIRRVTDGLKYSFNRIACNYEQTRGRDNQLAYYFDIIKYHSEWRNFKENISHWNFELEHKGKGFNIATSVTPLNTFVWEKEDEIPLCEEAEKTLQKLLSYCKDNNIKAEFTLAVSTSMTYGKAEYIRKLIERYGYELYVFNEHLEDMKIDYTSDFVDAGHLNLMGSQKVSSYFGEYISNKYSFSDKRTDKDYASWNVNLNQMKEEMAKAIAHAEIMKPLEALMTDYEIKDNNEIVIFAKKNEEINVEYALYVYERDNEKDEWERTDTQWYTTSGEFAYVYNPDKYYHILRFARLVENTDVANQKYVAALHFDGKEWIIESD